MVKLNSKCDPPQMILPSRDYHFAAFQELLIQRNNVAILTWRQNSVLTLQCLVAMELSTQPSRREKSWQNPQNHTSCTSPRAFGCLMQAPQLFSSTNCTKYLAVMEKWPESLAAVCCSSCLCAVPAAGWMQPISSGLPCSGVLSLQFSLGLH